MDEQERKNFICKEIKALYEELDETINRLIILKPFFKNLMEIIDGAEPFYKLNEKSKENNFE